MSFFSDSCIMKWRIHGHEGCLHNWYIYVYNYM